MALFSHFFSLHNCVFRYIIDMWTRHAVVKSTTVSTSPLSTSLLLQVKTDMDFEIVSKEECSVTGDREEMYSKLEQDLIGQVGC